MSTVDIVEQELRQYVEMEPSLRREERIQYLMAIFRKHFELEKLEHSISYSDLMEVVSHAVAAYPKAKMPFRISNKEVHQSETNYVLIIEAFVGYLNKNRLLRRLAKFNFTR